MNRRIFLQSSAAFTVFTPTLLLDGCGKVSKESLAQLAQTLGGAVSRLEAILGNTAAAQTILTDTGILVTAIDNWVPGTTDQDIIQAAGILMSFISDLPVTSETQALIDLALVTLQAILALLPPTGSVSSAAVVMVATQHAKKPLRTPSAKSLSLAQPPKTKKDFTTEWNKRVPTSLSQAKIT